MMKWVCVTNHDGPNFRHKRQRLPKIWELKCHLFIIRLWVYVNCASECWIEYKLWKTVWKFRNTNAACDVTQHITHLKKIQNICRWLIFFRMFWCSVFSSHRMMFAKYLSLSCLMCHIVDRKTSAISRDEQYKWLRNITIRIVKN